MAERGIDITGEFPKPWTDEVVRAADVVVTMGCGDACPIFPGKRYLNWELDDPAGQDVEHVRPIRDDIERRVRHVARRDRRAGSVTADLFVPATREAASMSRLVIVGGSDAGISAGLRARELDPHVEPLLIVADAFPNFSICGIPYHVSGEVPDWRSLAHRTRATSRRPVWSFG